MKNHIIEMEQLQQGLELLNQVFDRVRIVYPLGKKTFDFNETGLTEVEGCCFDFWAHKKACSNCISLNAYQHKETHFKLEYKKEKIYMVLAVPIQDVSGIFILELLKDITHSLMYEEFSAENGHPLLEILNEVRQLQVKDALTAIFNRRFIDERLPVDMYNSRTNSKPLSIVLADIDRFKMVNDTYGHVAGDHVLKEFAQILESTIPNDAWVARYGGEEFLISLSNIDYNEAELISEEIRRKVESHNFVYDNSQIKITSSFGVCTLNSVKEIAMESLIEFADKNLYNAKDNGRNRVVISKIE